MNSRAPGQMNRSIAPKPANRLEARAQAFSAFQETSVRLARPTSRATSRSAYTEVARASMLPRWKLTHNRSIDLEGNLECPTPNQPSSAQFNS